MIIQNILYYNYMIIDNIYNKFNINKLPRNKYERGSGVSVTTNYSKSLTNNEENTTVGNGSFLPVRLWGQYFDDTKDIDGDIEFKGNISYVGEDDGEHGNISAINGLFHNLTVTGAAHFFELVIDKIKSVGGSVILSPSDGFEIISVVNSTVSNVNYAKLYFVGEAGDEKIDNMWEVNDLLLIKDFNNATTGNNNLVTNRYFWGKVTSVSSQTETITVNDEEVKAHWVMVTETNADGTLPDNSYVGASCVQLGNTTDTTRQGAIYLSAYDGLDTNMTAPFIALYHGISAPITTAAGWDAVRQTWFSMSGNQISGTLLVYDSNNNNRIKISPDTVGQKDSHTWQPNATTEIGVDGFYSGVSGTYIWNGQDEIELSYDDHKIQLDQYGIHRTEYLRLQTGTNITTRQYYGGDISSTVPTRIITPTANNQSYSLDKNDCFIVVKNNNPQYTVQIDLGDASSMRAGHKFLIKGLNTVKITSSSSIYPAGDSVPYSSLPVNIDNDAYMYITDGSAWYEFKGI